MRICRSCVLGGTIQRQRRNLGRVTSRGLEADVEERLGPRVTLSAGYTFNDATVTRFPSDPTLEGRRVLQVPRHVGTLQARLAGPRGIVVGLQARASSAQFDDDQNRLELAPTLTLDVLASAPLTRALELVAAVENLTDQRVEVGKTPVTTVGPPRLARLGFRLKQARGARSADRKKGPVGRRNRRVSA